MEIYLQNCSINLFSEETTEFYGWAPFQDKKATEKNKSASQVSYVSYESECGQNKCLDPKIWRVRESEDLPNPTD